MFCPKCQSDMETVDYQGVEVDRCRNCKGIWFDVGESHSLRAGNAAATIDTGDPARGKQTNEIDRYRCPRCGGGMMRVVDPQRARIKYEECTSCKGSFFDAGEFADRAEDETADLFERLAAPNGRHGQ